MVCFQRVPRRRRPVGSLERPGGALERLGKSNWFETVSGPYGVRFWKLPLGGCPTANSALPQIDRQSCYMGQGRVRLSNIEAFAQKWRVATGHHVLLSCLQPVLLNVHATSRLRCSKAWARPRQNQGVRPIFPCRPYLVRRPCSFGITEFPCSTRITRQLHPI